MNQLSPKAFGVDHPRICREDLDFRKEIGAQRNDGNAQFSLCCTSTKKCRMAIRRPAFFLCCDFCSLEQVETVHADQEKTFPQKSSHRVSLGIWFGSTETES